MSNQTTRIEIRKTGRTWGVFSITLQPNGADNVHGQADLLEGGFFSRAAAERARNEYAEPIEPHAGSGRPLATEDE